MPLKKLAFPVAQLLRRNAPEQLLAFFKALDEAFRTAFADAERICPAERDDRPAVYDRGNNRRHRLDRAFRAAALKAKLPIATKRNSSGSWSYPVVQVGPYSITLAIGERLVTYGSLRLRCKGGYMRDHVEHNGVMNPQERLDYENRGTKRLIPNGFVGAVVVAEPSMIKPDTPNYIGFYIPKENLSGRYFQIGLNKLIPILSMLVAARTPRKSAATGRTKPVLRRDSKRRKDSNRP